MLFILSDIHSRIVLKLEHMVEAGFEVGNPKHKVILNGDYFDRGFFTMNLLASLEEMKNTLGEQLVLIKGNHDDYILDFYKEYQEKKHSHRIPELMETKFWVNNGGGQTLLSLFGEEFILTGKGNPKAEENLERIHNFAKDLIDYYETDEYIITHASIDGNYVTDNWDRDFLFRPHSFGKKVIVGHTPFSYIIEMSEDTDAELKFLNKSNHEAFLLGAALEINGRVWAIDNGIGDNVVILKEENDDRQ